MGLPMRSDYRPDIDGLRAIAVLAVILFHYGANWLPGGFAGVDVFFVISGYLITKHLSEDIQKNGFAIGPLLVRFYNKRVRRILPALLGVLAATLAAGWFLLMPGDYASTGASASYSAFGLGNLYFYWNTGYFDREAELQPLLHLWSLGVEEQFYFVWPVLLVLIMWASRINTRLVAVVIAMLVALGLAYSVKTLSIDPKAALFLPLPRAWELGIGALLAFLPSIRVRWASELAGIAGFALIAWPLFALQGSETSLGLAMLPAVIGAAMLIWPRRQSAVSRLLANRPMRFIGLISYSLYLWHWPILVLHRHYNNGGAPTEVEALCLAAAAFLAGWMSWKFIEQPFRAKRRSLLVIPIGTLAALSAALAGTFVLDNEGFKQRIPAEVTALSGVDVMWKWDCPEHITVKGLSGKFCAFGAPWKEAKTHGILWGDSHSEHLAPLLDILGQERSAAFFLYNTCPAALGGSVHRNWKELPNYRRLCEDRRSDGIAALLSNADINLVVLSSAWVTLARQVSTDTPTSATKAELLKTGIQELVDRVSSPSRKIVVVSDTTGPGVNLADCAAAKVTPLMRAICSTDFNSRYILSLRAPIIDAFKKIKGIRLITAAPNMCPKGECSGYVNGEFVYRDASHLRRNLSRETRIALASLIGLNEIFNDTALAATPLKPDTATR